MTKEKCIQVVALTMRELERECLTIEDFCLTSAVEIGEKIWLEIPEGRGSLLLEGESPRQGRDRINGFRKD